MAGIVFTFAVGLMLGCQVKAETTIDLNGNKVEVSVWTKQTSMKDGSYKIISSEAGTIAYFDKDGNLLKVENKATGKIIMNNMKEPETTTKQPETSVKAADKITMPKVKKLKKKQSILIIRVLSQSRRMVSQIGARLNINMGLSLHGAR